VRQHRRDRILTLPAPLRTAPVCGTASIGAIGPRSRNRNAGASTYQPSVTDLRPLEQLLSNCLSPQRQSASPGFRPPMSCASSEPTPPLGSVVSFGGSRMPGSSPDRILCHRDSVRPFPSMVACQVGVDPSLTETSGPSFRRWYYRRSRRRPTAEQAPPTAPFFRDIAIRGGSLVTNPMRQTGLQHSDRRRG
jgi:hypothetical protein